MNTCDVNIYHSESTVVYYPESYSGFSKDIIDKKEDKYKTSGIIGDKIDTEGHIEISIEAGKVELREK